jgi:hypothetical protein
VVENRNEGLLVKIDRLERAEQLLRRMVEVRRVDGALLLQANPDWAGAIKRVLVDRGLRVTQLRHAGLDLSHQ